MNTKMIFIRHADTEKDPSKNAALWGLSSEGTLQAAELANVPELQHATSIYVSTEQKTTLTIDPLLARLNKTATPLAFFDEVHRGDAFLTKEEFEREKKLQLSDLSHPAFGGESALDALQRFKEGVELVANKHPNETTIIVSHGTILSIYFADLLNKRDELPDRWKQTPFCSYGIVKGNQVVQDITR